MKGDEKQGAGAFLIPGLVRKSSWQVGRVLCSQWTPSSCFMNHLEWMDVKVDMASCFCVCNGCILSTSRHLGRWLPMAMLRYCHSFETWSFCWGCCQASGHQAPPLGLHVRVVTPVFFYHGWWISELGSFCLLQSKCSYPLRSTHFPGCAVSSGCFWLMW